jgi:chromosome segregation ATPase
MNTETVDKLRTYINELNNGIEQLEKENEELSTKLRYEEALHEATKKRKTRTDEALTYAKNYLKDRDSQVEQLQKENDSLKLKLDVEGLSSFLHFKHALKQEAKTTPEQTDDRNEDTENKELIEALEREVRAMEESAPLLRTYLNAVKDSDDTVLIAKIKSLITSRCNHRDKLRMFLLNQFDVWNDNK